MGLGLTPVGVGLEVCVVVVVVVVTMIKGEYTMSHGRSRSLSRRFHFKCAD